MMKRSNGAKRGPEELPEPKPRKPRVPRTQMATGTATCATTKAAAPAPRDPLVKPRPNDEVKCWGENGVTRKVFNSKGNTVVYNIDGGPFAVDTYAQWAKWAQGGTVVAMGST